MRANHVESFKQIFDTEILPIVCEKDLKFKGIWETMVGNVGEFMELWEFSDMNEFRQNWFDLLNDARLQEIFKRTGPMVENENFTILEEVCK
jgi:hypothetical protein